MPKLVCVHAHPDDEAIFTGGVLVLARQLGFDTAVVVLTDGSEGVMPSWVPDEPAAARRDELEVAAATLGVGELVVLGWHDSGMEGSPANVRPGALAAEIPDVVAHSVAEVLGDLGATTVTAYDKRGVYGHPDHVAVHDAVMVAAGLVGGVEVLGATFDRVALGEVRSGLVASGRLDPSAWDEASIAALGVSNVAGGVLEVDVSSVWSTKQAAMAAHASQVPHVDSLLGIPPGVAHRVLMREWFTCGDAPGEFELACQSTGFAHRR